MSNKKTVGEIKKAAAECRQFEELRCIRNAAAASPILEVIKTKLLQFNLSDAETIAVCEIATDGVDDLESLGRIGAACPKILADVINTAAKYGFYIAATMQKP